MYARVYKWDDTMWINKNITFQCETSMYLYMITERYVT